MKCCVCLEPIDKNTIIMTKPCTHWICPTCSCKMIKIWKEEGTTKKRCPMCRVLLVSNLFTKQCQYTMIKIIKSSIFPLVPTTEFIQENYEQMLVDSLMAGNLQEAFKFSFIIKSKPTDVENTLCPLWPAFYHEKAKSLECCTWKIN